METIERISKVILQGDESGLVAAMTRAEGATKAFQGSVSQVGSGISKMAGIVGSMTAVLAGGAMFKECVNETLNWTGEAVKLSKTLGITTEQASIMNLALGDVYLSMDTMITASDALTKNSLKNKAAFEYYGIALKDSNNQQRSTVDIMGDVNTKILTIAQGRDREIVGMQLYGKAWSSVRDIIRLTTATMEEASRKAAELHLIVGPNEVEGRKKYKAAMNDVQDLFMSMKIQVGNQLLPVLTNLAIWMNDVGPTALSIFEGALKGIVTFGKLAVLGIVLVVETAKAGLSQIVSLATTVADVVSKAISGDFKGAVSSAKSGYAEMMTYGEHWLDSICKLSDATAASISKMWLPAKTKALPVVEPKKAASVDPYEKDKGGNLTALEEARFKAELAGIKMREAANKDSAKTMAAEEDYWYRTRTENEEVYRKNKYEIDRQALINTKALLDEEIVAVEKSSNKKLSISGLKPEDRQKIREEEKKEIVDRISEQKTLNAELERLELAHLTVEGEYRIQQEESEFNHRQNIKQIQMDTQLAYNGMKLQSLEQERNNEALRYNAAMDREKDQLQQSLSNLGLNISERERIISESDAKIQLIEVQHAATTKQLAISESNWKTSIAGQSYMSLMSLADSFYQLSGKKSKAAFLAYQIMKSGETIISTGSAAMKAYDSYANIPYVGTALGAAAAAAAVVAGAVQLKSIWSSTPEGGGALATTSSGQSIGAYGDTTTTSPVVTQPTSPQQTSQNITLIINNPIGERKWFEDNLPSILKDFSSRNVNTGVQYA